MVFISNFGSRYEFLSTGIRWSSLNLENLYLHPFVNELQYAAREPGHPQIWGSIMGYESYKISLLSEAIVIIHVIRLECIAVLPSA